jgi:hypothetical protein
LAEILEVPQGLEDTAVVEQVREIDVGAEAILEADVDRVAVGRFGVDQKWRAAWT